MTACWPADRRTPCASNIVTSANTAANANNMESKPSCNPQAVANAVAPAAWLEGIPPVPINHLKLNLFSLMIPKKTFIPWAMAQAKRVVIKILLFNKACNLSETLILQLVKSMFLILFLTLINARPETPY
jgi:hypothetical protein